MIKEENFLQFKSSKIDITPDFPCRLTGMKDKQYSDGVFSQIEANAMLFNNAKKSIYIISIDTLFISKELKLFVNQLINKEFGKTDEADIIIFSTHTHYAPSLEEKRIKLGKKDSKYYTFLINQLQKLILGLKTILFVNVTLKYAENVSQGITCNRRRKARRISNYFKPFVAMEANPKGYINECFKILNIYSTSYNKPIGIIWSFPCHPTNFPNKNLINSEFPGYIREMVRKEYSNGIPVVYLPGFCGDVRAFPPKRKFTGKFLRTIFQLSYPVSYYRFINVDEYLLWRAKLLKSFQISNKQQIVLKNDDVLETFIHKESLVKLGVKVDNVEDLVIRKIKISSSFAIYTMSAEPVGKYSEIFESNAEEKFTIYTGYADEVFGYLPASSQISEGGYEVDGYFDTFLAKGKFKNNIDKLITNNLKNIN